MSFGGGNDTNSGGGGGEWSDPNKLTPEEREVKKGARRVR